MTNANEPAFTGPTDQGYAPGLTKREYFAAMAMQGLRASKLIQSTDRLSSTSIWSSKDIAIQAVRDADALIKQLNAPE